MRLSRTQGGWVDREVDLARLGWENLLSDPRAIAAMAISGELLFFNDAMQEMLGWSAEELDRQGWMQCLYPSAAEREVTYKNLEFLARPGGPPRRHSRPARRGDGSRLVLDMISYGFALDDGRRAVFTTAVDATKRNTPLSSERGFRELVEDAPDILSRIDVKTGRFLFVSRAVEPITGFTPEELYADPELQWRALLPAHRAAIDRALKQVLSGEPQWLVLEYRRRDGRVISLHQALYPIRDAMGRVVVVEGVARDLTALRELEHQLQRTVEELKARNVELSSLDRLKSQLLANVSHELRTPLVTIKGYNELILRGSLGVLTPRQRRALEIASISTERLVDLIESLLDFARLEEGRLTLRRERIDVRLAIQGAVDQMTRRITEKGLTLDVNLGTAPLEVDGDQGRLSQVLKVLLSNAEKFVETPGVISVRARAIDAAVVIEVRDTGIGIPAAAQPKIFDRFYQVDSSTTRRFSGAGLGLAVAREIVLLHEGEISVESVEGAGSTFTVRLPVAQSLELRHGSGQGGGQAIVEERPVLLLGAPPEEGPLLRARIEAEGLVALEAGSGAEVIRRARRHRPDAVVLALGDDLVETIEALQRDAETVGIPVIAMVEDARREEVLRLADYVVRPSEGGRLAAAVRRLLSRGPEQPRRVLIVDDEPEIVDFMRFVLERQGYQVMVATSGEAALKEGAASKDDFDLIILDIALAGLDGIEVCRQLKAEKRTAHVPVLMVTAMSDDEVRRRAFAAGADGCLVKPFGVDEFLRQVRLHLRADPAGRTESA